MSGKLVTLTIWNQRYRDSAMAHADRVAILGAEIVALEATVDAQQERIDELEAQLFITQADALPLFEVMHLEPVPEFPSIRSA